MDIYQPASYGRKRRRRSNLVAGSETAMFTGLSGHNETAVEYSSTLSKHWRTFQGPSREMSNESKTAKLVSRNNESLGPERLVQKMEGTNNTKFGDNIGFSVIMPPGSVKYIFIYETSLVRVRICPRESVSAWHTEVDVEKRF